VAVAGQFQRRIDEPEQRAGAAGQAPGFGGILARMVKQQNRRAAAGELMKRLQRCDERGRIRFAPPRQERRQRIDDEQIECVRGMGFAGPVDEALPIGGCGRCVRAGRCGRSDGGSRRSATRPDTVVPVVAARRSSDGDAISVGPDETATGSPT